MSELRIIAAGFGGQGILFLGKLIAYSGMIEGKHVTWFPSYGAEMRGGTANCTAIISDEMIGSPIVRNPDILVAMNTASLGRFQLGIRAGGLLLFDSSLIPSPELRPDILSLAVPASELAASLHASKPAVRPSPKVECANMVMFGALLATTGFVKETTAMRALGQLTPKKISKTLEGNRAAIMKGMHYLEDTARTNR